MRRILPILIVIAVAAGLIFKDRLIGPLGTAPGYLGYVEGETTLISSPIAGRLVSRAVQRGEQVKRGAALFQVDPAAAEADIARYTASVAEFKAQLENILTGKREAEQEIVRAQLRETMASLKLAEQDLDRSQQLIKTGAITRARYDQSVSQVEQLKAKVQQMQAQEKAGALPGRVREIEAAKARIREAEANLDQAVIKRGDLAPVAPADAMVENTFFDVGEWVAAGQPVLSLLAADKLKLRFFVPEDHVARAQPGTSVTYRCDGCASAQSATITYVAPRAEFTPPVIYSETARRKLVFLVEAKPAVADQHLRTGLPVEVDVLPVRAP